MAHGVPQGGNPGEELLLRLLQGQQEQLTRLSRILERQETGPQQGQRKSLVDTKAIGRPEKLGGSLQEASKAWRQWSYLLEMWLASQFPDARKILAWATSQDAEIKVSDLIGTTVTGVTEQVLKDFNRQLEVVLGTLTVDSPGDITMNSSAGSGLDMYRRLHSRLDPTDMVTSMRYLTLMSTHPVKEVHELIPAIERWDDMHRRYAERKDCESLKEQQKMVSLLGLALESLQSHLELNLSRLTNLRPTTRFGARWSLTLRIGELFRELWCGANGAGRGQRQMQRKGEGQRRSRKEGDEDLPRLSEGRTPRQGLLVQPQYTQP